MTGYQLYRFYLSINLHFTKDGYNVFEHRGGTTASVASYEKRRDRKLFDLLAHKFESERDAVRFLVANFAYRHSRMMYDGFEKAFDNLAQWIKVKESLTKTFSDDLHYIEGLIERKKITYDQLINCTDNHVSGIIKLMKQGLIHVESACLIHQLNPGLVESWRSITSLQKIYDDDFRLIMKLSPFVKSNESIKNEWDEFVSNLVKE